jgi:phosphotransferase system enzyme I (PtsI)
LHAVVVFQMMFVDSSGSTRQETAVRKISGIGIGRGIAVGPVARVAASPPAPTAIPSELTPAEELARADASLKAVTAALTELAERLEGTAREVLRSQIMMTDDPDILDMIAAELEGGTTAEWAVARVFDQYSQVMVDAGGYMAERAADMNDVARRVVADLRGLPPTTMPDPPHPFVLVAEDLAPAETAQLDLTKVLALVTQEGGPTSHTAILARENGIVAVVGVGDTSAASGASTLSDGDIVIVEAASGLVVVDPDEAALADAAEQAEARERTLAAPATPGALADGTPVPLLANLGSPAGAAAAAELGAEGVGLFRTEFLFLDSKTPPSIEAQAAAYTELLSAFPGRKVVVRVLDAGADKPLPYLTDAAEENPALGVRGIRALAAHEGILRDQLRALAAADAQTDADLWVMAPMVSGVAEARYFAGLCRGYSLKTSGVMIEVPSAALLADRMLTECEFASIGTNDLTQYTLAADRLLGSVARFQDPWNPAVLALIASAASAGRALGKPVGVCGEAAADPALAVVLVGLGVTSLSMAPPALADVRAMLLRFTADQARAAADAALAAAGDDEARTAAMATLGLR